MTNHPNRASRASPMAATVKAAREALGMTPEQAGTLIHERGRRWTDFESGTARMHPAAWELFQLKTAGLSQRLKACITPGYTAGAFEQFAQAVGADAVMPNVLYDRATGRPATPSLGETWYDRDTGCAFVVLVVEPGLITARGCAGDIVTTLPDWFDNFQRDPVAV